MFYKKIFYLLGVTILLAHTVIAKDRPQRLTVPPESATRHSITLLWDKPEEYTDISTYYIYQDGKKIASSDITNYTVKDLKPDTRYNFYIKAKYQDGRLSAASKKIKTQTKAPGKVFNISDFGAKGDGETINTKAIQNAIDACTKGGTVLIPAGTFKTGALFLKSNMTLYIEKGGTLQGSINPKDYLPMIPNRFEGWEMTTYASLLNAGTLNHEGGFSVKHLSIRGKGTVNGGGGRLAKAMTDKNGRRSRGRLILLMNCQDVNIQGLTISGSPCWTIHYIYSDNITLHDLNISSNVTNGDGIDPDSSTDSYIFNCTFSTGDDCIAIKSGKNPEGYQIAKPTKNVWISNCNFKRGHSIAIGSEMSGGVSDVLVRDCITGNLLHGLQIKGTKDRGGYVKDISVKDCALRQITVYSAVNYNNDGEAAPQSPYYKNLEFSHIDMSQTKKKEVIVIQGFEKDNHFTENVRFEDVRLPKGPIIQLSDSRNIHFNRVFAVDGSKVDYQVQNVKGMLIK